MVKHVILWKLKDEITEGTKEEAIAKIKRDLEALNGQIEGLVSLKVIVPDLTSSNADIMLDSTLESEEALKGYQVHPAHVAVSEYVKKVRVARVVLDAQLDENKNLI